MEFSRFFNLLRSCFSIALFTIFSYSTEAQVLAYNDTNINAHDYELLYGNVSDNDILPPVNNTFRFLNSPIYGAIEWLNDQQGSFVYLAEPENIASYEFEDDLIFYEVCNGSECDTALLAITLRHLNNNPVALDDTLYVEQGTTRLGNVSLNDTDADSISDPDGPYLYFHMAQNPQIGALNYVQLNGVFSYTAAPNFLGWTSFIYGVYDVCGWDDYGTVHIFVTGQNGDPLASDIIEGNIPEDELYQSVIINAVNDPENDPLTYSLALQAEHGIAWIGSNGNFTYMPSENFIGYDTIYYEVMDLVGQTDTAAIIVQVVNANNDAPVAPNLSYIGLEDNTINLNIAYPDQVDGDLLTYAINVDPLHGQAIISASGDFLYIPDENYHGTDLLTYRSCDSNNLCDIATITLQINATNDSPSVVNDYNEVVINGTLNGNLTTNVVDIDSPNTELNYALLISPSNGEATVNANGNIAYTPNQYFFGYDSLTYTVCDSQGACSEGSLYITVTLVNLAPEAQDAETSISEDSQSILDLNEFTFDFGNGDLTYWLNELSQFGSFNNITNVGFEFNPSSNLNGTFVINYRVCDTGNLCDSAQLSITIAPVNDSPLVNEGFITVAEDSSVEWLPEYSDIDSETLELSVLNPPSYGTLSGNTYIPNADFTGSDVFTYQVCDDQGECSSAIVEVTVDAVNDAPGAFEDIFFGFEDSVIEDNVSGNDEDIDSNNLVFAALSEDNPYNISIDASGFMQWLPPANFSGTVVFHYSVCDNNGACDTASVTIEILEINDSPIADLPSINLDEDSSTEYASLNFAFDIEGQELYQSLISSSGIEAVLNPETGIITLSTANNYNGPAFVVVAICDVLGDCIIDTIQVEITPVNDNPYGFETSFITYQDIAFSGSWYNHVFDIDDTTLSFSATSHFGSIDVLSTGSFLFTPLNNFIGQDTILLQACDSSNACVTLQYLISVLTPNQPPITQSAESTICQGASAIFDLSQLVSDEADSAGELQYTFISNAPGTFLTNATDHTLTINPSPLFSGEMIIEMLVCDNASPSLCSTDTVTLQIIATTTPIINEVEITSISCQGASDGSIHILDVLEETGVTFAWSNGSTDAMIENLNPGDYSVQINGLSECSESLSAQFTITEPQLLDAILNAQSIASELGGMIESSITGGTAPYSYSWSGPNGFTSENPSVVGLADPGEYSLVVTDANGCQTIVTSLITSISETNLDAINVYPNPATESSIYLQLASVIEPGSALRVYDACGRTILSRTTSSNREMLPTETWQAGIYTLCIEHKLQSYLARVVVIK